MKVLITGGTGFVGNNLARSLMEKGEEVGLLLRKESKTWRIEDISKNIKKIYADVSDKKKLAKATKKYKPDIIYNLAVYGSYPKIQKDLDLMVKTNIIGAMNLSEAADGIPIINAGSSSEYGIKSAAMKETDACLPDNDYGWTKLSQTAYFQLKGAVTLRLFSVYGPWEEPTRLIPVLMKSRIKKLPVSLINSNRDYIYVDDVIDAVVKASKDYQDLKGSIINIGSGEQTSVEELLKVLGKINPTNLDIKWDYPPIQTEPKHWQADIKKAQELLGWKPKHTLEEGLRKSYEWWEKWLN